MSSSESSAFEYRRRLPEVPRTVRFSGDVLNRIDDVADKIESVGSRMRQVENIISDSKMSPHGDQKAELIRLRDDVSRTLAAIDDPVRSTHQTPVTSPSDANDIRNSLQRLNSKIHESHCDRDRQTQEIERLRKELAEGQIKKRLQEDEDKFSVERQLRDKTDREQFLTQHLSAVSERAETVSGKNYELTREVTESHAENARLRKDCQSLVQEIEKLRLDQVESKRDQQENEKATAQLGRQVAEHRTQSERYMAESSELKSKLDGAQHSSHQTSEKLKQAETLRQQLSCENVKIRDELASTTEHLVNSKSTVRTLEEQTSAASLREISLKAELDSVRERNGALEQRKMEIEKNTEQFRNEALKYETENRCLRARLAELENDLQRLHTKLSTSEEHQSGTAAKLFASQGKLKEVNEHVTRLEASTKTSHQLQHQLEREIVNSRDESTAVQAELRNTKDLLAHEQAKNQMLNKDLENVNDRLKTDQRVNQQQIQCLRDDNEKEKKRLDDKIVSLANSSSRDVKNAQDANTAIRAELKAATDEVRHQTDRARQLADSLRDVESRMKHEQSELQETRRANDMLSDSNKSVKGTSDLLEKELLQSRQDVSKLDIILKRSFAIAKTKGEDESVLEDLPAYIEQIQQSNDAHMSKTQQVTIELEQSKIRNEKHSREFASVRRQLHDELNVAKDEALALTKRNSVISVENQELKMQLQGHKDKFDQLKQELDRASIKRELMNLNK